MAKVTTTAHKSKHATLAKPPKRTPSKKSTTTPNLKRAAAAKPKKRASSIFSSTSPEISLTRDKGPFAEQGEKGQIFLPYDQNSADRLLTIDKGFQSKYLEHSVCPDTISIILLPNPTIQQEAVLLKRFNL